MNASFKLAVHPNLVDTCISGLKTVYIDLDISKPVERSVASIQASSLAVTVVK